MFGIATAVIGKIAVVAVILATVAGVVYFIYQKGASDQKAETLSNTIDVIKERSATNEKIDNLTESQLCVALDGVWNKDKQICE